MRVKIHFYLARPRLCTSPILGTTPPNLTPYFFVPIQPRPNKSRTTFFLQKSTILIIMDIESKGRFPEKAAVLLDFVQMRGEGQGACPFLAHFHKCIFGQ